MARSASRRGRSGGLADRIPLKKGAVFGAAAYVVGLILTFVLIQIDSDIDPSDIDSDFASSLDVTGWVFYNAHFVDTETSISGGGVSRSSSDRIISEASLPEVLYIIVPVVLLIAAAYLLLQGEYASEVGDAALSGASVIVGYFPLAVIGTFLFEASESSGGATASVGPATGTGILLAGIIFPLVLGAVGGVIAFQTQDNRRGGYRR